MTRAGTAAPRASTATRRSSTLYTYLDGELTVGAAGDIAAHLDRCGYCGDAAHFEAELRAVIADCARARVPEPLLERIRAVLAAEATAPDATAAPRAVQLPCTGHRGVDLAVSGGPDSSRARPPRAPRRAAARTLHHVDHGLGPRRGRGRSSSRRSPSGSRWASYAHAADGRRGPQPRGSGPRRAPRRAATAACSPATRWTTRPRPCCSTCCAARGIDGLAAMSPATKPLLALRRASSATCVVDAGVATFVWTRRNFDLSLRRNLLRARVLPELTPCARRDLVPVLARQATTARDDARRTSTTSRGRSCPTRPTSPRSEARPASCAAVDSAISRGAPTTPRTRRAPTRSTGWKRSSWARPWRPSSPADGGSVGAAGAFASRITEPVRSRG